MGIKDTIKAALGRKPGKRKIDPPPQVQAGPFSGEDLVDESVSNLDPNVWDNRDDIARYRDLLQNSAMSPSEWREMFLQRPIPDVSLSPTLQIRPATYETITVETLNGQRFQQRGRATTARIELTGPVPLDCFHTDLNAKYAHFLVPDFWGTNPEQPRVVVFEKDPAHVDIDQSQGWGEAHFRSRSGGPHSEFRVKGPDQWITMLLAHLLKPTNWAEADLKPGDTIVTHPKHYCDDQTHEVLEDEMGDLYFLCTCGQHPIDRSKDGQYLHVKKVPECQEVPPNTAPSTSTEPE